MRHVSLILLFIVMLHANNTYGTPQTFDSTISPNTPHLEWREQASPNNINTQGPVTFLWPVIPKSLPNQQPDLSFDFVLSKHADLSEPLIHHKRQPWAFVNSHKALDNGRYYWQVTEYHSGKNISTSLVYQFYQTSKEGGFVTPPTDKFVNAIEAGHPRLLVTPMTRSRIKSFKEVYPKDIKRIIKTAKQYLEVELPDIQYGGKFYKKGKRVFKSKKFPDDHPKAKPTGRIFNIAINALAQAWLLTNDDKYLKEGVRWAKTVAKFDPDNGVMTPNGANGFPEDDFDYAVLMPTLAIAYDTFYEKLSKKEREVIGKQLLRRTQRFYDYFRNRLEARVMDNHAWQHTYLNFLEASLALAGDYPQANTFLEYAYGVWVARFPVQSITDGGWHNGKYVGVNFHTWTNVPLFLRRYTGVNYYQHPFFSNQVKWLMARMPPKSAADGFSGDGYEDDTKIKDGTVDWLNVLNAELQRPEINWYLKAWGKDNEQGHIQWLRMVEGLASSYVLSSKEVNAFNPMELNKTEVFRDTGIVNMHSSRISSKNNTSVNFRAAPWGNFGHNLPSNNAVNILFGGNPLFYPTGYRHGGGKHAYEWYRHTRSHNSVLINGKGQPVSSEAWGNISQVLDDEDITYVLGDASNAYSGTPSPQWFTRYKAQGVDWYKHVDDKSLKTFKRHLVFIRPSTIIIYDELAANRAADWDWRIHTPNAMQLTEFGASTKNATGRGELHLFTSKPFVGSITDKALHKPFNVDGRLTHKEKNKEETAIYQDIGWHYNAKIAQAKNARILAIIDISNRKAKQAQVMKRNDGTIKVGNVTINAELNGDKPANLQVMLNDGSVLKAGNQLASLTRKDKIQVAEQIKLLNK